MYIVEVIPLTILPTNVPQILSYFFNEKLEKGAIVEIPLGNRKIRAAVVASTPLEDQKISLKKSGFELKKISAVISEAPQISLEQFKIALWLSRHYYAPLGYCLKTVLPPFFLQSSRGGLKHRPESPLRDKKGYEDPIQGRPLQGPPLYAPRKPLLLLSGAKETLAGIMPFVKKTIEDIGQVLLIVPDASSIQYFYENLSSSYEVVKIHSGLNNKKLYEAWDKIRSGKADIILGTRQALFMPFKNLRLVIVDDVLHEFYKSDMTPKYNTPDLAQMIADMNGSRIVFVSPVAGVENYYRIKNKEYDLLDKVGNREPLRSVNMISEIKNGNLFMFSREFKNQLLSAINPTGQNKKILIFSPRRGHSGVLVCQNCGYAVKCKDCGTAFRVHKTTDFILVCHRCSRSIKMPDSCPNCKGFKLKTAGPAGTQKIYEEVQRIVQYSGADKIPVLILDADVIKNETEEEEVVKEMKNPGTAIIIATQMIFSHRYEINFDLIGVLNTDSLISVPDFRTEERLCYQIEKLLEFMPKKILIQTYNPENTTIVTAAEGRYKNFYEKELGIRKTFSYPPYSRLVRLTFRHKNRDKASYAARILNEKLKMAVGRLGLSQQIKIVDSYPSYVEKERGLFAYHIVLKILPELEDPRDILKFVPSNWSVDVDPRTII